MARILYLSILFEMGLFNFNEPFIIWNYFINFMLDKFIPPHNMPHVVFNIH